MFERTNLNLQSAQSLYEAGKYTEALAAAAEAIAQQPTMYQSYVIRAQIIYHFQLKNHYTLGIQDTSQAIKLIQSNSLNDKEKDLLASIYNLRARFYHFQCDYNKAFVDINIAIKLLDKDHPSYADKLLQSSYYQQCAEISVDLKREALAISALIKLRHATATEAKASSAAPVTPPPAHQPKGPR